MKLNILLPIILLIILLMYNFCRKETVENYTNKNKLVVILPVRDREENLKEYLENMIPIFNYQNIDYRIFVIEQSKNKRFNKGKINNIGFLEALKENKNHTRFLFNDVDNYPIKKNVINYNTKINGVNHFFGNPRWLGGFFMISKNTFQKVNGYSNNFWGWGGEDNDLQNRLKAKKVNIDRSVFYKRDRKNNNLINDDYNTRDVNKDFKKNMYKQKQKYLNNKFDEGLNNCEYKILKKYNMNKDKNITRILVDI
tara:strand:- start:11 stop:772 length:762 start_codon:yes stop_codon:yes gene_type:complete